MVKILLVRTTFLALAILLCSAGVYSQTTSASQQEATKFDEYGSIGGCDHSARLDNLAIQLQNAPSLKAQVIYYGPEQAAKPTFGAIEYYLVEMRGIEAARVHSIYGGPNNDLKAPRIELWLSPLGALPPTLTQYENSSDTFSGLFDDSPGWDSIAQGEGTGPPIPGVVLPSFAEMIRKRKNMVPYIVAFNGEEAAPGAWRRVAELELERLQDLGLETDRVKVIYGGGDKDTKIQLWILHEDSPPPVAEVPTEPLPEKTIQIGSFSDYDIAEERGERWAFKGFVDVLRSSDNLRACIIVRLESDEPEHESEAESTEESISQESTAAPLESLELSHSDLLRLAERWRTELAEKYNIGQDRFIVLLASGPKYSGNSLETWIVPSGAPLPDPNAEAEEQTSDEAEPAEEEPAKDAVGMGAVRPIEGKADKVKADELKADKAQSPKNDPPQLF